MSVPKQNRQSLSRSKRFSRQIGLNKTNLPSPRSGRVKGPIDSLDNTSAGISETCEEISAVNSVRILPISNTPSVSNCCDMNSGVDIGRCG